MASINREFVRQLQEISHKPVEPANIELAQEKIAEADYDTLLHVLLTNAVAHNRFVHDLVKTRLYALKK